MMSASLTFNKYQEVAKTTATYADSSTAVYPILGLVGEAGEVAEKMRDGIWKGNKPTDPVEARVYDALSLAIITGRLCERLKKEIRDKGFLDTSPDGRDRIMAAYKEMIENETVVGELAKELGDVDWYMSDLASNLNLKLGDVAQKNMDKLLSRKARGVIQGSGDNR
jgi:NTP pyrophosphatase (non-canonical NTP hydrolase)